MIQTSFQVYNLAKRKNIKRIVKVEYVDVSFETIFTYIFIPQVS